MPVLYKFKLAKENTHLQTLSIVNMWKLPYIWANVLTAAKNSLSRKESWLATSILHLGEFIT